MLFVQGKLIMNNTNNCRYVACIKQRDEACGVGMEGNPE